MKEITFEKVKKSYGETEVVKDLNLTVKDGEKLILLGPSGCGKSTILRMIAGLEDITSGNLYMSGQRVNDVPSGKRNVSMVFQNYALYPHMTVEKNITYALKVKKHSKKVIKERLNFVLDMLELNQYKDRLPKQLSGGQRQRVALARATVKRSDFFLLDEPLSNLDAQLRLSARKELVKIHEAFQQTIVYVTHDQVEAMTFADRIALMNNGQLQMLDTPHNVYHRPANVFTAKFIGSPATNIIEMDYEDGFVKIGKQTFQLHEMWARQIQEAKSKCLLMGIRPEHAIISKTALQNSIKATVKYVENQGGNYAIYLDTAGQELITMSDSSNWRQGEIVHLQIPFQYIHLFNKDTEESIGYPSDLRTKQHSINERKVLSL